MECKYGKRPHIKIPARYHRYPLPVPIFKWCGNWSKAFAKEKIPSIVKTWVKIRLEENKQALVFLPNIHLMEKALPLFQRLDPKIDSVHAEDPQRKQKVEKMRNKEIPILLTTTILERGVTFPNIDVAVVGAEDEIFTEAALVQISGRVGRSIDFPSGWKKYRFSKRKYYIFPLWADKSDDSGTDSYRPNESSSEKGRVD